MAVQPIAAALLAEAPAPVFLMSVVKPVLTFAALMAYGNLVTTRLIPDCASLNMATPRWSWTFLGAAAGGLLAVLLVPWWWLGFPVMLGLMAWTCVLYAQYRAKVLDGRPAPPLLFFSIDFSKRAAERRARAALAGARLRFERKDRTEQPVPERSDPAYPVYDGLQTLVAAALAARASRMDLLLGKQGVQVQFVVDSVRSKGSDAPSPELAPKVVQLLKSFAGLKLDEQRKFQSGIVFVVPEGDRIEVTVSSVGTMHGETVRVDFRRKEQLSIRMVDVPDLPAGKEDRKKEPAASRKDRSDRLADLASNGCRPDRSFSEAQVKLLKGMWADGRRGVVLIGARPGNGLTNLGLSVLGLHDSLTSNIQTLERRVEHGIAGVEHQAYDPSRSDYATQLQSLVRRGPDVVLVTEPGEPGVGKVITGAGSAGTLFVVAMPMDTPPEMIAAWCKVAGSAEAAAANLLGTVSQRLVRTLCETCRAPHVPTPAEAKMLGIPAGKQVPLFRQTGKVQVKEQPVDCPTCRGTGFIGLAAATEVLVLDDEARKLLSKGDAKGMYLHARRAFRTLGLADTAIRLVRGDGRILREEDSPRFTSLDEVKRVFAPQPAPGAKPAAAAAAPAAAPAAAKSAARKA
jgi:type II secretory ATPase GspE/PulE/Tfp pilus assembly ATPase PilB-like protein